ncbi:laccase [Lactarius psammicola]|nr:laccase [Lactarius psammicola]
MMGLLRSLAVLLAAISGGVCTAIGPTADLSISNLFMAPDGFPRFATLAGYSFPGPVIRGKKGDTFSINVHNLLWNSSLDLVTSVHWHGISQTYNNYADGGAFVSQCPIIPYHSFTYQFPTLEQTGTYWYHSHFKTQYCDGLQNTIITLADWYHYVSPQAPSDHVFNSTLINGKGRYLGGPTAPLAVVNVDRGKRYRLRLVSISCEPAFNFSIDGHHLTIIEVDGVNHQPLMVDSLQIFAGYQLNANQKVDNYWIRAVPNVGNKNFTNLINLAILRYQGAPLIKPSVDPTKNIPSSVLPLKETDLHPLVRIPVPGKPEPGGADININLVSSISDDLTKFLMNNASFVGPDVPILLQILSGKHSASELLPKGSIYPVAANKSVEVSFPAGVRGGPHPMHLHGHHFHVVRSAGSSSYNFENPVYRDVVSMGSGSDNVTIRFFTDNPGPWFFHCHIEWHLKKGFAVVFAEDTPDVSAKVHPSVQWEGLCPTYNQYATGKTNNGR